MSEQASKKSLVPARAVLERVKFAESVGGILTRHAEAIGQGFARELGSDAPNGEALANAMARRLTALANELVESDLEVQRERDQGSSLKDDRARAEEALRGAVVELQEMVTGMFGGAALTSFKLAGGVPGDVQGLVAYAQEATSAMGSLDLEALPKPRIKGASVDLKEWAAPLNDAVAKLVGVAEGLASESRTADQATKRKATAADAFDRQFRRSVSLLEALLHFVGETEAAEKLKPAIRGEG